MLHPTVPLNDTAEALDQAFTTIRRTAPRMGTDRPSHGQPDLTYARCNASDWVDGFWSGQLWLAYSATGDQAFFQAARQQRPYFAARLARPASHNHDLGFLYTLSAVADYTLTGDADARQIGLDAADALAGRFNAAGKFIRAWNDHPRHARFDNRGRIIVDCIENLALLFWAADESGDTQLREVAIDHAATSAQHMVRDDGSSYHTFHFDPDTGTPLEGTTHQGFSDDSCWSRGQAWGIHGFAQTYLHTGMPLFRDTAQRLADYAIARLPDDGVPLWDFCLPADAPQHRDSSAAAIMVAGLLLLADTLADAPATAQRYHDAAQHTLATLIARYSTADAPHAEGLLRHGAAYVAGGRADCMLPYGDYFYVEALLRAQGHTAFFW